MASLIAPISPNVPITADGQYPSQQFLLQINNLIQSVTDTLSGVQAAGAQAAQAVAVAAAVQTATNVAQQTANTPPAATTQASATASGLTVMTGAWTPGPQVDLVGVTAGNLALSITLGDPASLLGGGTTQKISYVGSNLVYSATETASGYYRIVEIIGASETVVYPSDSATNFIATLVFLANGQPPIFQCVNSTAASLAAFLSPRTSTGNVSYRLDFQMGTPATAQLQTFGAYLFASRT